MKIKKSVFAVIVFSGGVVFWLQPGWSQVSENPQQGRSTEEKKITPREPGTASDTEQDRSRPSDRSTLGGSGSQKSTQPTNPQGQFGSGSTQGQFGSRPDSGSTSSPTDRGSSATQSGSSLETQGGSTSGGSSAGSGGMGGGTSGGVGGTGGGSSGTGGGSGGGK